MIDVEVRERTVRHGDVELATASFGDPAGAPLLLIMGQMASMLWWPAELCERLAGSGLFVIRYDNRDTGRSTASPPGEPRYTVDDMVGDAVAILDDYGIYRAHVAGMSMGGAIAQLLAARRPDRVRSLALLSTSPIAGTGDLPDPSDAYIAHIAEWEGADLTDVAQLTEMLVADSRALTGAGRGFDEAATREFVATDLARTRSPASLSNHALLTGDDVPPDVLDAVAAPALVIHGTADPLLPVAHGEALAAALPNARLVTVDGAGHEIHRDDIAAIATDLSAHAAGA